MHRTVQRRVSFAAVALMLAPLTGLVLAVACPQPAVGAAAEPSERSLETAAVIDQIAGLVQDNYLDAGVAEQCAGFLRQQESAGAYGRAETPEDLAEAITTDLQAVSHDLHMRVAVVPQLAEMPVSEGETESESQGTHPLLEKLDTYHFEKRGNFGVMDVKWLSGNVGYLDLRAFLDLARVRPKIESAMTLLSDTDAMIIDLRSLVRGGYPETVAYIAGYFFDKPTLLQRIVFPRTGSVDETWTVRAPEGPDLSDVPLFILTSEDVFSAGEAFTYAMQAQGRATVVGTTTKGGAHLTRSFKVEPGYDVYVPIGRSVNPVTGGNWEGVGVTPDVVTDVDQAMDVALERARAAAEERRAARESEDRELALDVESLLLAAVGQYAQGEEQQGAAGLRDALHEGLAGGVLTEDMINDVGYYCLENGLAEAAVEVFRFNAERFPDSANAYDSLGEALVAAGQPDEARASYHKALELNPRLSSSQAALNRLGEEQ